jgi:ribosomal protein S18 acetylase RimI-like enzyme
MALRTMTSADIPAGLRLNQLAGWNQTEGDWDRFLEVSPQGCFVTEVDGQVCGTVTTVSFERRFAWIGMVLVDPQCRGRGIGTSLLERAIEHLHACNVQTMKLDATPQGKPLYNRLGFVEEYEIERWTLRRSASEARRAVDIGCSASPSPALPQSILEADREIFGADRSFLLKSLHEDAPGFTIAIWHDGVLGGYTFGRRGLVADHLGPWMAKDAASAQHLLETFLARSARETLIVDCLKSNCVASDLLKAFGFTYSRPLTRMYRGPNHHPGRPDVLCAILGPEFG